MAGDYSIFPLIFSQSNLVSGTNNSLYRFQFARGINLPKGSKVGVGRLSLYYSWFNITSSYNNNAFSIIWPVGAGTSTFNITLPNGNYSIDDLNSYLQAYCVTNNLYLIDSNGNYVYYFNLAVNTSYYSVQLTCFPVPTALPTGYTAPVGFPAYPLVATTPQLVISSSNDFGDVLGYNAGTYPSPSQATTYSKLSDTTPQVSNVDTVILTCNLLNNQFDLNPKNLYSFSSAGSSFGSLIQSSPAFEQFVNINQGVYNQIEIQFITPNNQVLPLNDSNIVVELLIQIPDEFAY
jgi:hypothetical protein